MCATAGGRSVGSVGVAEQCVSDNCVPKNSKNFLLDFKRHSRNMTMRWHVTSLLICYDDDGQGQWQGQRQRVRDEAGRVSSFRLLL